MAAHLRIQYSSVQAKKELYPASISGFRSWDGEVLYGFDRKAVEQVNADM